MSIELTVVCLRRPDLVVCDRVAPVLLRRVEPAVDVFAVDAYEIPDDRHEFTGRFVWSLEPRSRTSSALLAIYVFAVVIALLYLGDLHDDVSLFPEIDAGDVFHECACGDPVSADELWAHLRAQSSGLTS